MFPNHVGKVRNVLCVDTAATDSTSYSYWMNKVVDEAPVPAVYPLPSDVASILYTSGTTGKPKGVELTHENIVSNFHGVKAVLGSEFRSSVSLAFLPWGHAFGHVCELYALMFSGSAIAIVPSKEVILECLPMVRPTVICSVPALFNKVYDGVMAKIELESPIKKKVFQLALANSYFN